MNDVVELTGRMNSAMAAVEARAVRQQFPLLTDSLQRRRAWKQCEQAQAQARRDRRAPAGGPGEASRPWGHGHPLDLTAPARGDVRVAVFEGERHPDVPVRPGPAGDNRGPPIESHRHSVAMRSGSLAELAIALDASDVDRLTRWLGERILSLVELCIKSHDGEPDDMAGHGEGPVPPVKVRRFAAWATLEVADPTSIWLDDRTKEELAREKGLVAVRGRGPRSRHQGGLA